jgi:site-specific DNA-methyltransferase (adenine-specific)
MQVNKVNINEVKTNPKNPRLIKDDKFRKLVKSIQEFPQMLELRPIVVDENNIVLGGNMRLKACKEAGLKEVFIVKADNLTELQKDEFIVKDNVGFGEWDWDMLANEWDVEKIQDWGLDLPVDLSVTELEAEEDDFSVPQGGIETDIVLGDLFEIGEHRLLCGDSTDSDSVAKLMNGEKADLVATDPPYNVALGVESVEQAKARNRRTDGLIIQNDKMTDSEFLDFLQSVFNSYFLNIKDGSPIYVFCPLEDGAFLNSFLNSGLKLQSILIWLKNSIVMCRKDHHYKHEPILYGWKEGAAHKWYGGHDKSTIIECNKPPRNGEHPTMKPIELMQIIIERSSKVKDIVLDLFLGSGSTMVASHQLKRKCYGMELDPKYCQVILERMIKLDPTLKVKRNGEDYTLSV